MPLQRCPKCTEPGRLLEDSSKEAIVYYFRCDACGKVWSLPKHDPHASPTSVTKTPQPNQ